MGNFDDDIVRKTLMQKSFRENDEFFIRESVVWDHLIGSNSVGLVFLRVQAHVFAYNVCIMVEDFILIEL